MRSEALSVGYYASPTGGPGAPANIQPGRMLFELITAGAVFAPHSEQLCGPGWVFVHHGGQHTIWRTEADGHYECLTINLASNALLSATAWPRQFRWSPADAALAFAHELLDAFHRHDIDHAVLGRWIRGQLGFRLAQFERRSAPDDCPPAVALAIRHLERHYRQEVSIDELAALAGLSSSHLHAQFRTSLGLTPHQYLIQQRMQAARHLLVTSLDSVGAIAASVGYANPESFCRTFRKHHQQTAVAYRRSHTRLG
ncbi:MAG: AraC family transcriptional regulator [Planctomycetota bacterium]|jgi:AraC family transcriptional regulator of arabinose operon|nr:AraC family transcriptional regulator [Planctomycetota bacterium]